MTETKPASYVPTLLAFLAGAAVGAIAVALTTPKTGPELRDNLKDLSRQAKAKAGVLADEAGSAWDDLKDRSSVAAADLQHGMAEAAKDLRG